MWCLSARNDEEDLILSQEKLLHKLEQQDREKVMIRGASTKRGNGSGDESKTSSSKDAKSTLAAAKARRQAISDIGNYQNNEDFVCPTFVKTEEQSLFLTDALKQNFFLYQEMMGVQTDLVAALQLQNFQRGAEIMRQGDTDDQMYVLETGTVDILVNGEKVKIKGPSDVIGELALLYQVSHFSIEYSLVVS